MKRALTRLLLAAVAGLHAPSAQSREVPTLSAYEVMTRVDKSLRFKTGLNKLQLTITSNKGKVSSYKINLFQKEDNTLIIVDSISKGQLQKILYTDSGLNIYVYDKIRKTFYHKQADDKFDSILGSGYYYIDLSGSSFLDNYTPKFSGKEEADGKQYLRLSAIPLDPGKYSRVNILVDPETYEAYRIDYFDRASVLMKSLKLTYGKYPVEMGRKKTKLIRYPVKWEMMDMSRGTISILEFFKNIRHIRMDNALFKKENIEK